LAVIIRGNLITDACGVWCFDDDDDDDDDDDEKNFQVFNRISGEASVQCNGL
jgi:hypothetical protein